MKKVGTLEFFPISENKHLVPEPVLDLAEKFSEYERPLVAEIDPTYMGGQELCDHYGIDPSDGANCVIVQATKGDSVTFAAVVTPVGMRADLNGAVRRQLDARKVSLAPLDEVLKITQMEYGSITPFGLPKSWKILVHPNIIQKEQIIIGGGRQISKILISIETLKKLPDFEMVEESREL